MNALDKLDTDISTVIALLDLILKHDELTLEQRARFAQARSIAEVVKHESHSMTLASIKERASRILWLIPNTKDLVSTDKDRALIVARIFSLRNLLR
ncbi:hypothetical protein ValSw41_66 [Vibrio phage ValSw4_1]|nr:hypothetical protein ValSw41_66 [Vibrio phage ValSw4_1]